MPRAKGPPARNLAGATFNFLTVLEPAGHNDTGQRLWLCQCVCGARVTRTSSNLPKSISCGCKHRRKARCRNLDLPGVRIPAGGLPLPRPQSPGHQP